MCHWLSVAMACNGIPDTLILDEPATRLDPVSQRQVGVAIFIGCLKNYVAFCVLVDVTRYSLFLFLPLISLHVGRCGR